MNWPAHTVRLILAALLPGFVAAAGAEESKSAAPTSHWAFKAPVRVAPPAARNRRWVRNPIDAFVLARLEAEKIPPSPEADRTTLIRRLSFDLLGLPPRAEEVREFVNDRRANAYERLVDRLLASPHFGEQWGRHWLDLARYADSDGYEKDGVRPYAYLYRDWVIDALNRDMPFDQFTVEQLAGDLLPDATRAQKTATGFHRQTLTNKEGGVDQEEFRCKAVVDRVSTTASVWLGLTVACAECHNHKYDPISQREFYQLYAFFNNASEKDLPLNPEEKGAKPNTEAKEKKPAKPKGPAAAILSEEPKARETRIHVRGDFLRRGEAVEPATLQVLHRFTARGERPDRLDLAAWLVDPANPLTARVTVNRAWQHLFGRALTPTLDDFGTRGEQPSHPELLDWLATEFVRLGWSQKSLIKLIVTTSTYRQASAHRPELEARDPLNILLARQNRYRLEAENVRDAWLAASGLLKPKIGGPSVRPALPADIAAVGYANSIKWKESEGDDRYRRGLYTFFQRTVPYPMLTTFDAPDSNASCARRERSNTPLQALTLLNDPVFFECAQALGLRIATGPGDVQGRIRAGFEACMGRPPTPEELTRLRALHAEHTRLATAMPDRGGKAVGNVGWLRDLLPEAAGFVAVARTLMNLDEFVTRE